MAGPSAPMVVSGKTHGNANVYVAPGDTLTFLDVVTYAGTLFESRNPMDPSSTNHTTPDFAGGRSHVSSMTLPIGMDNSSSNVVKILDIPPSNEDPYSELGRQRFYNKSDLIITITNNRVIVNFNNNADGTHPTLVPPNSGGVNVGIGGNSGPGGGGNSGPGSGGINVGLGNSGYSFVNTNVSFYDYREGKQVIGTELDIRALTNWLATSGFDVNVRAQAQTGHGINSIYINDQRSTSGRLTAIRVANGQYLPNAGLTIATPQPLYVKGHFNAPDLGSTNTASTKAAALVSDAITILSPNWSDSYTATNTLSSRGATNATVNAAFMSGIVGTTKVGDVGHYSGGVENFPRFLENWSGSTLTYNGSMVVMFNSRQATNFWVSPGTYYNPPTRKWAFDKNFLEGGKLPPNTPQVRKLDRGQWSVVKAN